MWHFFDADENGEVSPVTALRFENERISGPLLIRYIDTPCKLSPKSKIVTNKVAQHF